MSNGDQSLLSAIGLGIISWFTPENIGTTVKIFTAAGAFVASVAAVVYYIYATIEKRESIKQYKKKNLEE